jgi:hypothetical protein
MLTIRSSTTAGGAFRIPAPFAGQTSRVIREYVDSYNDSANKIAPMEVCVAWEPYFLDRIVDFWRTSVLEIGRRKFVLRALERPVDSKAMDVTARFTTSHVCAVLCDYAVELRDEALLKAGFATLRRRLLGEVEHAELLESVEFYYNRKVVEEHKRVLKRILLSAVVIKGMDIFAGGLRKRFIEPRMRYPQLGVTTKPACTTMAGST